MAGYPLLPVPPSYQGPSGEVGQILLDGLVIKVSIFHGRVDDEADWHVYIRPDRSDWPVEMYCEVMVLDDFDKPFIGDDQFFTADVRLPFRLSKPPSVHPAWDLGLLAIEKQGDEVDCSAFSRLVANRGRAYLQGPYVNDEAHDTRVEIHPLDSIAFAMDESDRTLAAKWGESGWPTDFVRWRVAFFANSALHRINEEDYLKRDRTTTWLLDLPEPPNPEPGNILLPSTITVEEQPRPLRFRDTNSFYDSRGVRSLPQWELREDPRDGRQKFRVSCTMIEPDERGGLIVRDYLIRVKQEPPVVVSSG